MTEVLNNRLKCSCRDNVVNDLLAKMPDSTAFTDLPILEFNSSAPAGGRGAGPLLKKQASRGAAAAAEKKRLAAKRANQLVNILNSFVGCD